MSKADEKAGEDFPGDFRNLKKKNSLKDNNKLYVLVSSSLVPSTFFLQEKGEKEECLKIA